MKRILSLAVFALSLHGSNPAIGGALPSSIPVTLEAGWDNPPPEARLRAYWWWLNGNVTPAAITRDLEEMKAKGFGGALICDAGGAEQTAMPLFRTARHSFPPRGGNSTNTRCAKQIVSAWRSVLTSKAPGTLADQW